MDQLKRAWDLLEEGERPEGMSYRPSDAHLRFGGCWSAYSDIEVYDRLCQAVEGVNAAAGLTLQKDGDAWLWRRYKWNPQGFWDEVDDVARDPDRLTAACNALEAERGGA